MTLGLGDSTRGSTQAGSGRRPARSTRVRPVQNLVAVPRPRWERRYARLVVASDAVAVALAVGLNLVLGFGSYSNRFGPIALPLGILTWVIAMACLKANRSWEPPILGAGSEEFTRLLRGLTATAVLLALIGLATLESATRPWVFGVVPLGAILAFLGRMTLRKRLHRRRAAGRCMENVLAIGDEQSLPAFVARTRRDHYTGWSIVGVCTPTAAAADGGDTILGVPVVGDLDSVATIARSGAYHAVAIGPAAGWSPMRLRSLAWDLEGTGVELVVDPGLMEVAGPRLHITPIDGLPLLRLSQPAFTGFRWLVKHVLDRIGALLLILLAAPLLLVVAIAVRADGGPVFFRQTRVGRYGRTFSMIKFRSMVTDADRLRPELQDGDVGAGPMFKMRNDPRVTRVGAVIRRYSIDELPQLFNVLGGSMTLVGPRPPLPEEVETYSPDVERRLLVRPGLTGLWQISGRSDLTWEESVRLDLRYVENWTLALDALILWKTVGVVLRGSGAY